MRSVAIRADSHADPETDQSRHVSSAAVRAFVRCACRDRWLLRMGHAA